MTKRRKDTLINRLLPSSLAIILCLGVISTPVSAMEDEDEPIEIIEGEDRIVYEYRQNGILIMIKVVPKNGRRPYYMVPADGAPHFESLDHKRKLYPQWVIVDW